MGVGRAGRGRAGPAERCPPARSDTHGDATPRRERGAASAGGRRAQGGGRSRACHLQRARQHAGGGGPRAHPAYLVGADRPPDRKSTRLNSSHVKISYAVFCLKKKKNKKNDKLPK